jgi:hypothetical protein
MLIAIAGIATPTKLLFAPGGEVYRNSTSRASLMAAGLTGNPDYAASDVELERLSLGSFGRPHRQHSTHHFANRTVTDRPSLKLQELQLIFVGKFVGASATFD